MYSPVSSFKERNLISFNRLCIFLFRLSPVNHFSTNSSSRILKTAFLPFFNRLGLSKYNSVSPVKQLLLFFDRFRCVLNSPKIILGYSTTNVVMRVPLLLILSDNTLAVMFVGLLKNSLVSVIVPYPYLI